MLQISYVLRVFTCSANKHRKQNFCHTFYKSGNAWITYLLMWHILLYLDVRKSISWIGQSLFSMLQLLKRPLNLSIWIINSNINSNQNQQLLQLLKNWLSFRCELFKEPFLNPTNHITFLSVMLDSDSDMNSGYISLNINSIPIG